MKLIEVPVYNKEGDLQFTATITPDEAQHLLQFAINFKLAMASSFSVLSPSQEMDELPPQLDD